MAHATFSLTLAHVATLPKFLAPRPLFPPYRSEESVGEPGENLRFQLKRVVDKAGERVLAALQFPCDPKTLACLVMSTVSWLTFNNNINVIFATIN